MNSLTSLAARPVFVGFRLPRRRLGVKLLPLIDVEQEARAARFVPQPVADQLRQR